MSNAMSIAARGARNIELDVFPPTRRAPCLCDRTVRSPREKEHDVKISMVMVVAGAAIAFAAPIATAGTAKSHHSLPAHKIAKHGKVGNGKSSTKVKTLTPKPLAPRPPLYVYIPGFTGTPFASSDLIKQCETGGDCTGMLLCDLWGHNCSTTSAPSTDQTDGQSPDQSSSSQPAATVNISDESSDTSAAAVDASNAQDVTPTSPSSDDSNNDC